MSGLLTGKSFVPVLRSNWLYQSFMALSKYISKSRTKRLPLTTKRVGKGFTKGYGAIKGGFISSKGIPLQYGSIVFKLKAKFFSSGKFIGVKEMQTQLVVPDLTNFKLKAYIGPGGYCTSRTVNDHNPDCIFLTLPLSLPCPTSILYFSPPSVTVYTSNSDC
eukprot:gene5627-11355_t